MLEHRCRLCGHLWFSYQLYEFCPSCRAFESKGASDEFDLWPERDSDEDNNTE